MKIDIERLSKLFHRDITLCPRCGGKCDISIQPSDLFGDRPHAECPKCKGEGVYPWGGFFIDVESKVPKNESVEDLRE